MLLEINKGCHSLHCEQHYDKQSKKIFSVLKEFSQEFSEEFHSSTFLLVMFELIFAH